MYRATQMVQKTGRLGRQPPVRLSANEKRQILALLRDRPLAFFFTYMPFRSLLRGREGLVSPARYLIVGSLIILSPLQNTTCHTDIAACKQTEDGILGNYLLRLFRYAESALLVPASPSLSIYHCGTCG